ncbi:hypothetical protein [Desulfonema limicola]|nr:hypothetical protein [Desulfonema limicola]
MINRFKMPENISEKKDCFGDMEKVFPTGSDGLRHSPESCLKCRDKTQCLRAAIQGSQGIKVKEEKVDRAYESGTMGFFERWSRKKYLYSKKKREGNHEND